jgi:hypothetical protein
MPRPRSANPSPAALRMRKLRAARKLARVGAKPSLPDLGLIEQTNVPIVTQSRERSTNVPPIEQTERSRNVPPSGYKPPTLGVGGPAVSRPDFSVPDEPHRAPPPEGFLEATEAPSKPAYPSSRVFTPSRPAEAEGGVYCHLCAAGPFTIINGRRHYHEAHHYRYLSAWRGPKGGVVPDQRSFDHIAKLKAVKPKASDRPWQKVPEWQYVGPLKGEPASDKSRSKSAPSPSAPEWVYAGPLKGVIEE